ncbi:MAG: lysozyme inhibitor LprI family protein [Cuspidothrix sp.]
MKNLLRKSFTIGLILSVVTFTGIAGLAQKSVTQAVIAVKELNCSNDTSLSEQTECFRKDYEQANRELNRVYKQVISDLSAERKQKLIRAEQAWIKYRDTNCEYRSSMWGGVQRVGFNYSCLARMTRERTQELRND